MEHLFNQISDDNKAEILDEILDPIWDKCQDGSNLAPLNDFEKHLIVARTIQFSVFVGGINSYFFNNGNKYRDLGLEAFKAIGLTKVYDIFKEANELFPVQPIPDDLEECRKVMESQLQDDSPIDERWDTLSSEFYDLEAYIVDKCLMYIKNNTNHLN